MSFYSNECRRRERRAAGLYGQALDSPNDVINLRDAAHAGRLWVELLVYNPATFYPGQTIQVIEKDLADKLTMQALFTGVTGLAKHGAANYARKAITDLVGNTNSTADRVELVTTPSAWTWASLLADPNGWALRYAAVGYDAGGGDYIPCFLTAEDIVGKTSNGENFTLSVPVWLGDKHSSTG